MKRVLFAVAALLPLAAAAQTAFPVADVDALMAQAIQEDRLPGGVVLVGHQGRVIFQKAYGFRSHAPDEPMTLDTIFDAASLTKVVVTSSCVMKLFEQGKIRLNDPVTNYLPEFQGGKSPITVRHLLTHFSGLRPDLDMPPAWSGRDTGMRLVLSDKPVTPPAVRFVYSDLNFILLGAIVERVSGLTLDEFARRNLFVPLGMKDSTFNPPASLRKRIAPTEELPGAAKPLRGVVHDPTARAMGGVAGHAGLFTTAADLSKFAEMMVAGGKSPSGRLFATVSVEKFTTPQSPPAQPILRGLGWDLDSPFSGNRGELFPLGSYGHTGFTGTSLWIDPYSQSWVILLTNSVYPHIRPAITAIRGRLATITAAAVGIEGPGIQLTGYNETLAGAGVPREINRNSAVLNGIDVALANLPAAWKGKRIGLITNHTGITRDGRRNVDTMLAAGLDVAALFSPEHGWEGQDDRENIDNSRDRATGIPVWSLYKEKDQKPSPAMLAGVDLLVFDIQDAGARFYTYLCTMRNAMQAAAGRGIPFYVLDRPNPVTGVHVEGPVLETEQKSFIGCCEIPVRHGMTLGELAQMINHQQAVGADLHVIAMRNWARGDWFDSTGLTWLNPSPNLRGLNAALLYPGVALLEASKDYSVGRGTDAPFEQIGAAWIRGAELAGYLNSRYIPGVRIYPVRFRPASSNLAGKQVEGVRFVITDRNSFHSVRLGLEIAVALAKLYPGKIVFEENRKLIGNRQAIRAVSEAKDPRQIVQDEEADLKVFLVLRSKYLIYKE